MRKTSEKIRILCECAVMVAAAQVLGYLKLFRLPQGGSITLNMLPVFILCARRGFGPGMLTAFAFSLLQLLLDGITGISWASILGDYLLAYSVLGIAGLFRGRKGGLFIGIAAGSTARFLVSWVTGAVVWGQYMPDVFFGMPMTNPWIYSALYNGSYIFAGAAACAVAGAVVAKPLGIAKT
ncbi:MAG: energy-coupled thiamine transporter ThiT [Clostridia bacterium]|nr:energy-coupled thiamine transporter ThiT [Clostridia bacterium]